MTGDCWQRWWRHSVRRSSTMTSALATACNSFSEVRRSLVIVGLKVRSCRTERTELEFANWSSEHELSRARSLVCGAVRKIIIGSGTYSSRPNCSSLKLDILHTRRKQQNKKNCSIRSSISRNTAYITCYLVCKRTVCHWSSPICQQTAAHICKD